MSVIHQVVVRSLACLCLVLSLDGAAFAQDAASQAAPVASDGVSPAVSAKALADVLRDEQAREAVLRELDRLSSADAVDQAAPPSPAVAAPAESVSVGRALARETQAFAENVVLSLERFWNRLMRSHRTFASLGQVDASVIWAAVTDLALVVAVTVGTFLGLRHLAKGLYRHIGATAREAGAFRSALIITASNVVEIGVVVLAWAIGYAVALGAIGNVGSIGIQQTMYLNAFLLVELVKVGLRAVLSPSTPDLRLVSIPDRGARILSLWVGVAISVIGYGQLLVVPIINQNVSFFAGRGMSALALLLALVVLTTLVMRYRRDVAAWILGEEEPDAKPGLVRLVVRYWHVPTLAYFAVLLGLVITRPGGVLLPLLYASAQIAGAVVLGAMLSTFLKRAMVAGVSLPSRVNDTLPLLESRLNGFVPRALYLIRWVIVLAVTAFVLDTLGFVDVNRWLQSQVGIEMSAKLVSVTMIILASFALWLALSSWIDYRLNPAVGTKATARAETLLSLLRNAATVALIVISTMFVLSEIGIDIAPLIASAGVLGLAIGFGAQKLVQDIITGVFIQLENAINVGDVITVGGTTGTVERLTVRSVSLRDIEGAYHIIPFSSVDMVSNYMRDFGHYVCDMGIAYRERVEDGKAAMFAAFEELRSMPEFRRSIMGDLQWFGVQSLGDSAVILRARIKCAPGQQWAVGRAYQEIAKRIFDERGIEIPFPHQTIYFGELKEGQPPTIQLAQAS